MTGPDPRATARTRARYQRIAPIYDAMETLAERRFHHWRKRLWSLVQGPSVLEVGVGTGKNMPYYPDGVRLTAIDLTPGMLDRARRRASRLSVDVDLQLGDVQALPFEDGSFDSAVATFVFCSVPDPVSGLREMARVVKPDGRILLLEHVRSGRPVLGRVMDVINPIFVRMTGANINRRTVENVRRAGLRVIDVEDLGLNDIFKLIVAQPE
jgi:ubiquinone/menaquinone biosynthesis C-methylase UbiE